MKPFSKNPKGSNIYSKIHIEFGATPIGSNYCFENFKFFKQLIPSGFVKLK